MSFPPHRLSILLAVLAAVPSLLGCGGAGGGSPAGGPTAGFPGNPLVPNPFPPRSGGVTFRFIMPPPPGPGSRVITAGMTSINFFIYQGDHNRITQVGAQVHSELGVAIVVDATNTFTHVITLSTGDYHAKLIARGRIQGDTTDRDMGEARTPVPFTILDGQNITARMFMPDRFDMERFRADQDDSRLLPETTGDADNLDNGLSPARPDAFGINVAVGDRGFRLQRGSSILTIGQGTAVSEVFEPQRSFEPIFQFGAGYPGTNPATDRGRFDEDLLHFSVTANELIRAIVESPGPGTDSVIQAYFTVQEFGTDTPNLLGTADANGPGLGELLQVTSPGIGFMWIRVYPKQLDDLDNITKTEYYDLRIQAPSGGGGVVVE